MSMHLPSLEARMSAQERMTTILHARIEELSRDMTASFQQLADYQIATERKLDARFDKVEAEIASIKATMATKEDIATLEHRLTSLDGKFDQVLQMVTVLMTRLEE